MFSGFSQDCGIEQIASWDWCIDPQAMDFFLSIPFAFKETKQMPCLLDKE